MPCAPEVLNVLGRVGQVVKKESHQVLVSFKIPSSAEPLDFTEQTVTLRKGLVESAQHLSSCNGQQLRVVAAKERAQQACTRYSVYLLY
jgi:hypothetical protein